MERAMKLIRAILEYVAKHGDGEALDLEDVARPDK